EPEEGGRVYEVKPANGSNSQLSLLGFGAGDINLKRIHIGDMLWKTSDPDLERRLRQSFQGDTPRYRRSITVEVHGSAGKPLTVIARDEVGHAVKLNSAMSLVPAEKQSLDAQRLEAQLGRLGGTSFNLSKLESFLQGPVMLPLSELNRLRRHMVA